MRRLLLPILLLAIFVAGWRFFRPSPSPPQPLDASQVTVNKFPVVFASRTFDPAAPPPGMPPLAPYETAACDSNFLSSAIVGGDTRKSDVTHGTLTVTHVRVTLQLQINVWLPLDAPQNLVDHEAGHRQISELLYQGADDLAARVAASYIGKQVEISGADLDTESGKTLHDLAAQITAQYNDQLNPNSPQLLYDSITQHGRNAVAPKDAVAHALKNASVESPNSLPAPAN